MRNLGGKPNGTMINTPSGIGLVQGRSVMLKGQAIFPDQITLQQSVAFGSAVVFFVMNDACGLNVAFGVNVNANSSEFDVVGSATITNLKTFLLSYVGIIQWINYTSTINGIEDPTQLGNNLLFRTVSLMGDLGSYTVSVNADKRNTQFQKGLETKYPNGAFCLNSNTSLGVTTSAPPNAGETRVIQIVFKFSEWISYDEFLARNANSSMTE